MHSSCAPALPAGPGPEVARRLFKVEKEKEKCKRAATFKEKEKEKERRSDDKDDSLNAQAAGLVKKKVDGKKYTFFLSYFGRWVSVVFKEVGSSLFPVVRGPRKTVNPSFLLGQSDHLLWGKKKRTHA